MKNSRQNSIIRLSTYCPKPSLEITVSAPYLLQGLHRNRGGDENHCQEDHDIRYALKDWRITYVTADPGNRRGK